MTALTPEQEALSRIARHVVEFNEIAPDLSVPQRGFWADDKLYLIGCIARDTLAEALPDSTGGT